MLPLIVAPLMSCVSQSVYQETLAKLERSHQRVTALSRELEAAKQEGETQLDALRREREWLGGELMKTRHLASRRETDLQSSEYHLAAERRARQELEAHLERLQRDRAELRKLVAYLEQQLETALDRISDAQEAKGRASGRLESLERERAALAKKLEKARSRTEMLDALMAIDRQAASTVQPTAGRSNDRP